MGSKKSRNGLLRRAASVGIQSLKNGGRQLYKLLMDPGKCWLMSMLLLLLEAAVNVLVIEKVAYTEIDWRAYMQEVEGVLVNRTTDYALLKGDTGPLVYPAGFVWFYSGLYLLTDAGSNVRLAQFLFVLIYLLHMALVFRLMSKAGKLPPWVLLLMTCTSYRIHSIFVLRLFNDPVCMLFLYASLNAFVDQRWTLGSLLFSMAVSIKMNILLFAPALFLLYLATQGIWGTLWQLTVCAAFQVAVALPFITTYPVSYFKGAFNLGRVFLFEWTVNWRFLPESVFVSPVLHIGLLLLHALLILISMGPWWRFLKRYHLLASRQPNTKAKAQLLLLPLYMANFIGIAVSRSLHYQFYVWYYHQLPYLLWCTPYSTKMKLLLWGVIELCWNTFPSTNVSSALLHLAHLLILVGLFLYMRRAESAAHELLSGEKKVKK